MLCVGSTEIGWLSASVMIACLCLALRLPHFCKVFIYRALTGVIMKLRYDSTGNEVEEKLQ